MSSKESLELVKLLYTACNTQDTTRLSLAEQRLQRLIADGKVTPAERSSFEKILGQAKAGEWRTAEAAAFRFAQDQTRSR